MIVVFEGVDGAGKGTVVKAVKKELERRGIECRVVKTPISPFEEIRSIFDDAFTLERALFYLTAGLYADRIFNKNGEVVYLFDRHIYSSIAYPLSTLEDKEADVFFSLISELSFKKTNLYILLKPDLYELKKRLKERLKSDVRLPDEKLEKEFIEKKSKLDKLYNDFYSSLVKKIMPMLTDEYKIFPNNTPEDIETIKNFVVSRILRKHKSRLNI